MQVAQKLDVDVRVGEMKNGCTGLYYVIWPMPRDYKPNQLLATCISRIQVLHILENASHGLGSNFPR